LDQDCVQQAIGWRLRGIHRFAGHLEPAFDACDRLICHLDLPISCKTRATARCSNSILKPLCARACAPRAAARAASTNVASSAGLPIKAVSLALNRQGIGATPPAASLASTTTPALTRSAAATDTTANSNDARSLILRKVVR